MSTDQQIEYETIPPKLQPAGWVEARPTLVGGYWKQVLLTSLPLVLSDTVVLLIGITIGHFVSSLVVDYPLNHPFAFAACAVLFQTAMLAIAGLYPAAGVHPAVELRQLVLGELQLAAVVTILLGTVQHSLKTPYAPMAVTCYLFAAIFIPIARSFVRSFCRKRSWWGYPTLLVGDRQTCDQVAKLFNRDGRQSLRPLGRFQDADEYWRDSNDGIVRWLGPLEEVLQYARQQQAYWLILAMPEQLDEQTKHWFEFFRRRFPHVILIDSRHELPCLWNRAADCGGLAAMKVEERLLMPEQRFFKRLLDISLIVLGSVFFVPIMLLIGAIILLTCGRPIFYGGRRVGLDGRKIRQWKFRSMVRDADAVLNKYLTDNPDYREEFERDQKLKDDPRVTRFGQFIRKTSLDELPQLWNVIRGEMSLVGPRPITEQEVLKYGTTMREYASVRPGLTGMWQISGRSGTTYEERKAFDRYYVRNWSPWLDIYILARTIKVVMKCEGAY